MFSSHPIMLSRFFDQLDIISIYFNISYFNFSDTRKKSFKLASKDITRFIHSFVPSITHRTSFIVLYAFPSYLSEIRKIIVSSGGLQRVRLIEDTDILSSSWKKKKKSGTFYVNEFKVSGRLGRDNVKKLVHVI